MLRPLKWICASVDLGIGILKFNAFCADSVAAFRIVLLDIHTCLISFKHVHTCNYRQRYGDALTGHSCTCTPSHKYMYILSVSSSASAKNKYTACLFVCLSVCLHGCMHACMYVRTYAHMYVCVCACVDRWIAQPASSQPGSQVGRQAGRPAGRGQRDSKQTKQISRSVIQ